MATTPTPEQGKPILDFSAGTFDGSSNLFQSRNGATEHVNGDDVADYVNTSRIYNGLDTTAKTPVGAINEINAKDASDIPYSQGVSVADKLDSIDSKLHIEAGKKQASSTQAVRVTFANAYTTPPTVVIVPLNSTSPRDYIRSCTVTAITTTYFEFVEQAISKQLNSFLNGTDDCEWIAYGV